jgi:hypothetical protein
MSVLRADAAGDRSQAARPAPLGHRLRAADVVDAGQIERNARRCVTEPEMPEVVGGAGGLALTAGSVVAEEDEDGVLPLPRLLQCFA